MPPLHAAVALAERDAVPVLVREHLHFDMPRLGDVLLHEHDVVAERVARLRPRALELLQKLSRRPDDAHALAPATLDRLEQHGVADLGGLLLQPLRVLLRAVVPGDARHPRGGHDVLARALAPHGLDGPPRRADERHALLAAPPREGRVLAEEAVARVDGLAAPLARGAQDALAVEVAAGVAEVDGRGRGGRVLGARVRVGVDGGDVDALRGGGAADAAAGRSAGVPFGRGGFERGPHRAISPRFAIRIEEMGFGLAVAGLTVDVDEARSA